MDKGYTENGFIVDLTHAKKTSEVIYELSRILDMEEAKGKEIYLKLGEIDLSQAELTSVKALIELMDSQLTFISTNSQQTLDSSNALGIGIKEFTDEYVAPDFAAEPEIKEEVSNALDKIFGSEEEQQAAMQEAKAYEPEKDVIQVVDQEEIKEIEAEIEAKAQEETEEVTEQKKEPEDLPTLYIRRTIRSGQSISSDGNVLILGDVNPGAEVIAKGDITVWGVLGGIAHAGSEGNNYAKIRALKLNPVQIRIGKIFARRPDTVNLPFIQKTSEYVPEEAFTHNGGIVIRKIHQED